MLELDWKNKLRQGIPSLEDKVNSYLDLLYMKSSTKTPDQIISDVLHSEQYSRVASEHPEIDLLIKAWQEKAKSYTYKDKVRLITNDYTVLCDKNSQGIGIKAR